MATKILLLNIPTGPFPTTDGPVAVTRVIGGLDCALGCEVSFLDAYLEDLPPEEVCRRAEAFGPHIVGISAILTHTYAYVKRLSTLLKARCPRAVQVLGGEMAVVSNILLQRTAVDFCVTGESEPTFSRLIRRLQSDRFDPGRKEAYKDIPGLAFLLDGVPYFTGYAQGPREVRQLDYELVARFTRLDHYMEPVTGQRFRRSLHASEAGLFFKLFRPENLSKRTAQVSASTGCAGRCSFCHRFFKGYRSADAEEVVAYVEELTRRHEIGALLFWEESFGTDERATRRIVEYLKGKRLNWIAGAVRSDTMTEEAFRAWKEAGCVSIGFGIESCSQRMLDVMEKRTSVQDNLDAIRRCYANGIHPAVVLLLGMPGESEATVDETVRNLSTTLPDDLQAPFDVSINYFQAVPGTPGYEYARRTGLIGPSLDDEERYLESLYNVDASDIRHYLNFTDHEKEELVYWRDYILLELIVAYLRKHGLLKVLRARKAPRYRYAAVYGAFPKPVRRFLLKYLYVVRSFGPLGLARLVVRKLMRPRPRRFSDVREPLRKINQRLPIEVRPDDRHTAVLREGR
jgi:anaerobic magnesium-protoporphyrin IX monomethyl ester cyclase